MTRCGNAEEINPMHEEKRLVNTGGGGREGKGREGRGPAITAFSREAAEMYSLMRGELEKEVKETTKNK